MRVPERTRVPGAPQGVLPHSGPAARGVVVTMEVESRSMNDDQVNEALGEIERALVAEDPAFATA